VPSEIEDFWWTDESPCHSVTPVKTAPRSVVVEKCYLDKIGVETEAEPDDPVQEIQTDETGETSVDATHAAGRISGTYHQAPVNAGNGARVALSILNRAIPEFYNDWVAPEGYYVNYDRDVPIGVEEVTHNRRRRHAERERKRMHPFFEKR